MCGNWLSSVARGFGITLPGFIGTRSSSGGQKTERSAFIVVDMQNDFITGSLSLCDCPSKHNAEEIIPSINKLSALPWRLVVFTKDWHPPDHISFVTNAKNFCAHANNKVDLDVAAVYDNVVYDIEGDCREQQLWPAHCIQESHGAELHEKLMIPDGSTTVQKGTNKNVDSYSAFFDNSRLSKTQLDSVLKEHDISTVYICGVATDVCVNFTALDAKDLGYETYLVEDCCRGVHEENIKSSIQNMKEHGITTVSSEQVLHDAGGQD